jgi:large repetitive protein
MALVAALTGVLALSSSALAALSNPPAAGPIVFPMRDFVSADGYAPNTPLTFRVMRAGVQIATAHGTTDSAGLLEVNHPGGVCWEGSTPNIIAGDEIQVVTKEDPDPALEEGDALESLDVTAKPAVVEGTDIVVRGTAQDDAGNRLPIDHLEQRIRNKALLQTSIAKQELRAT